MQSLFNIDPKLDPLAVSARTDHAIAGQAALGLLQATERSSHLIEPNLGVLKHVANLNLFAQRAELTRKILERYLLGTEVARVDPVYVPVSPMSYSEYTFPGQDPSVFKSQHMPLDLTRYPRPVQPVMMSVDATATLLPELSRYHPSDQISNII
jgi:hypothetical protein